MRHIFLYLLLMLPAVALAQTRVTIFGDSYSTFYGSIPSTHEPWYGPVGSGWEKDGNDVTKVEQTWWHQMIERMGWQLEINNSWSGSTVGYFGYQNENYQPRSFNTRVAYLGEPDIIFCLAGTNDSWTGENPGEYKYANWTENDMWYFRPALARLLSTMKQNYPLAKIYFVLNTDLKDWTNESVHVICKHYDVPCIDLHDIDKQLGHPSQKGMKAIADQVIEYVQNESAK